MQIWTGLEEAVCETPTAVACGYFDGLHIGHAAVIGEAVAQAQALGVEPGVFTFTLHGGHPAAKPEGCELLTEGEKYRILEAWGVRRVLCPDFSQFQSMSPEAFVEEILCRRLRAAVVCCGEDFRFGSRASGDVSLLRRLCAQRGVQVAVVPEVDCGGSRVSSTRIRALLGEGRVEEANQLLGRAFGYDFIVIHGKRLGRTIDSPTINQRMPAGFVRLRHGVYASVTLAQGRLWPSVTNVGLRPTVEDSRAVNSETYLHGFSGDLYGQRVPVRLLRFLRDEQKFDSVERLRAQIQADAEACLPVARAYIEEKSIEMRISPLQPGERVL